MSYSLVVNPPNHFSSSLEIANNRRGLNLMNMLDGEAIRSGIHWIWPSVPGTCELVHCLDGRALSFLPNEDVFSLKCCWNGPIRLSSNRHWSFASTEGNRYELYRVPKKLWPLTFRPTSRSSPSSELVHPVKTIVLTVPLSPITSVWSNGSMFRPQ